MDNPVTVFSVLTIIAIIVIFAVFWRNPTEWKFKKGVNALKNNNFGLAEHYFKAILEKHPEASKMLDEITFTKGEIAQVSGNLDAAYDYFSQIKNKKAHEKLIEIDVARGQIAKKKGDLETAYQFFTKVSKESTTAKSEAAFIDFRRGLNSENNKRFEIARNYYLNCLKYTSAPSKLYNLAYCRSLICDIKHGILPKEINNDLITSLGLEDHFINDLIYRYSILLIKNSKYDEAEEIINSYLDTNIQEVKNLLVLIQNQRKKGIYELITEINDYLLRDFNDDRKLESLYNKINAEEEIINAIPDYAEEIKEKKSNFFSKLINKYINNQQFEKCLDLIVSYPNFIKYPELLKNAGICCMGIAQENKIDEQNYKKIIPIWLTAIYNDDVFINVLEYTIWDDEYTFTLNDSLGRYSKYMSEIKVGNINREVPHETNISIGSAQRELVQSFEKDLNEVQPESLHNKIQSFYYEEKEAIEKLVKTMAYDIPLATPSFAKEFGNDKIILQHLNWIYEKKQNEDILELGSKYITLVLTENKSGMAKYVTNYEFERFASSKWYADIGIDRIKSKYFSHLKPDVFKDVISRFSKVQYEFEKEVLYLLRKHIDEDSSNESLITLMDNLHQILPNSENLVYLFANYTTNFCINKINKKEISEIKVLELLVKAIKVCPENYRTAKNLAIFIGINLVNDDFLRKVKEVISVLKDIGSKSLHDSFINELTPQREELSKLMNIPNINYSKVRQAIDVIDELIVITKLEEEE